MFPNNQADISSLLGLQVAVRVPTIMGRVLLPNGLQNSERLKNSLFIGQVTKNRRNNQYMVGSSENPCKVFTPVSYFIDNDIKFFPDIQTIEGVAYSEIKNSGVPFMPIVEKHLFKYDIQKWS